MQYKINKCFFRTVADFPKFLGIAMEMFLTLCDDVESDIRMVADECLNRSIKVSTANYEIICIKQVHQGKYC